MCYVVVADHGNEVLSVYSPYPSYTLLTQLLRAGSVTALTGVMVRGVGWYLYATTQAYGSHNLGVQNHERSVSVYLLPLSSMAAGNAPTFQASAFQVASPALHAHHRPIDGDKG